MQVEQVSAAGFILCKLYKLVYIFQVLECQPWGNGLNRNPVEGAREGQVGEVEFVFAGVVLTYSGTSPHATECIWEKPS